MDPPDLDMSDIFLFWSFTGLTTKNFIGKIPAPRIIFRYEHENHQKIFKMNYHVKNTCSRTFQFDSNIRDVQIQKWETLNISNIKQSDISNNKNVRDRN